MVDTLIIIFAVGGAFFTVGAIVAAIVAGVWWLRRKRFDVSLLTAGQCLLMAFVYWMMCLEWQWFHQRKDGVNFPWYRDVAFLPVVFLQQWIVLVHITVLRADAFLVLILVIAGALALIIANFTVANIYWYGWGACIAAFFFSQLMLLRSAARSGIWPWVIWASSLILLIGIPLIQLLSWTMLQVLDDSPQRKMSEIAYLIVTAMGIAVTGLIATLTFVPWAPRVRDPEPMPLESEPAVEASVSQQLGAQQSNVHTLSSIRSRSTHSTRPHAQTVLQFTGPGRALAAVGSPGSL